MTSAARYARSATLMVALAVLGLWPFLGDASRSGVMVAAAVALPVQIAAFWALTRLRDRTETFLGAWVGGTAARVLALALAAVVAIRSGMDGAIAMLLALAGFFFALLLLEPIYFRSAADAPR